MADLIIMPKLGFDMAEGTLVEWTKKVGDAVAEGDVIATIETDKANVEVTSFKAGVIRQLLVEAGAAVPVNTPIAIVGAADEPIDLAALGVKPSAPAAKPEKAAAPAKAEPAPVASIVPTVVKAGPVIASPVARRMADELGIDLHQVTGSGPEGRIVKRDIEEFMKQSATSRVRGKCWSSERMAAATWARSSVPSGWLGMTRGWIPPRAAMPPCS